MEGLEKPVVWTQPTPADLPTSLHRVGLFHALDIRRLDRVCPGCYHPSALEGPVDS
jgi:hypothetical protein